MIGKSAVCTACGDLISEPRKHSLLGVLICSGCYYRLHGPEGVFTTADECCSWCGKDSSSMFTCKLS